MNTNKLKYIINLVKSLVSLNIFYHKKKLPRYLLLSTDPLAANAFTKHALKKVAYHTNKQAPENLTICFNNEFILIKQPIDPDGQASKAAENVDYFKKHSAYQPINAVILLLSPDQLIEPENLKKIITAYHHYLNLLQSNLNVKLPLYFVLTNLAQLTGFSQFFENLSSQQQRQPWGITLPLTVDSLQTIQLIKKDYQQLVYQLQQKRLDLLNLENSLETKQLIFSFPSQMERLGKKLIVAIDLLLTDQPNNKFLLCGLFFSSTDQKVSKVDFINTQLLNLNLPGFNLNHIPIEKNQCYFVEKLFEQAILPQSRLLGIQPTMLTIKKFGYFLLSLLTLAIIAFLIYNISIALKQNTMIRNTTDYSAQQYKKSSERFITVDANIKPIIPAIMRFQNTLLLIKHYTLPNYLLNASYQLVKQWKIALQRIVSSLLYTRLLFTLNQQLLHPSNNLVILYNQLIDYLNLQSEKLFTTNDKQLAVLLTYLPRKISLLIKDQKQIIKKAQTKLSQQNPVTLAYQILYANALEHRPDDQRNLIVFSTAINRIPLFFTQKGYQLYFQKDKNLVMRNIVRLNINRNLNRKSLLLSLDHSYWVQYHKFWKDYAHHITVKPILTLNQAILVATLLSHQNADLYHILKTINNHLKNYIATNSSAITNLFSQLVRQLQQIKQSKQRNQAEYQFAQTAIAQNSNNSLQQLVIAAGKAPNPLDRLLKSIILYDWQIIRNGALITINQAWKEHVLAFYRLHLNSQYPFNPLADNQVTLTEFNQFFGKNGIFNQFISTDIDPIVNSLSRPWKTRCFHYLSIKLNQNTLEVLELLQSISKIYASGKNLIFIIKPLVISSNLLNVNLTLARHTLHYAYGPQISMPITWPFSAKIKSCSITFTNFTHHRNTLIFNGPWCWFHLLDHANISQLKQPNEKRIILRDQRNYAQFTVKSNLTINQLRLSLLKNLVLPNQLS